jgi:hypothetical protein
MSHMRIGINMRKMKLNDMTYLEGVWKFVGIKFEGMKEHISVMHRPGLPNRCISEPHVEINYSKNILCSSTTTANISNKVIRTGSR